MTRIAVALTLLTASATAANAAQPASALDRCARSQSMNEYARCAFYAAQDAASKGDLVAAVALVDAAAQYIGDRHEVYTRSLEIRSQAGLQLSGYARETVYRCGDVQYLEGSQRARAIAACRTAWRTVQTRRMTVQNDR